MKYSSEEKGTARAKQLQTKRLLLRKWEEADAQDLFLYAQDPDVGPITGWPPHQSVEESLSVIQNVLNAPQCYAICEKKTDPAKPLECDTEKSINNTGRAIGAIELILHGSSNLTTCDSECELGFWLGKPYWGRGYMPEAAEELIRYGFEELGMTKIWCGYYDGNQKSKRVQEKMGFCSHHIIGEAYVPLMKETRICHVNELTRARYLLLQNCVFCHKERLTTGIVYEDKLALAFLDMDPINIGHVLLIPRQHYLDADEMPEDVFSHLMMVSRKIVAALKQIYHPDGYSIMQNGGAFNDVGHYHMHIFPRYQRDGFGWTYGEHEAAVTEDVAEVLRRELMKE